MTELQEKAELQLVELANKLNVKFVDKFVADRNAYLTGKFDEYQFWIYDTGDADFKSDFYDRIFEIYDYDNENDLLSAFLLSLEEGVVNKEKYRSDPQVSPRPLFNRLFDWIPGVWKNSKNEKS